MKMRLTQSVIGRQGEDEGACISVALISWHGSGCNIEESVLQEHILFIDKLG